MCESDFVNAAFEKPVEITSICGLNEPQIYFTLDYNQRKTCDTKDTNKNLAHLPKHINDLPELDSWWQSETLYDLNQMKQVNLTLDLGKISNNCCTEPK